MSFLYRVAQLFDVPTGIPKTDASGAKLQDVLAIVFATIAVISVLIIAIAGLSYVLSGGDSQRIAKAKDAILYAIIGLIVSILAYSIVAFVIGRAF